MLTASDHRHTVTIAVFFPSPSSSPFSLRHRHLRRHHRRLLSVTVIIAIFSPSVSPSPSSLRHRLRFRYIPLSLDQDARKMLIPIKATKFAKAGVKAQMTSFKDWSGQNPTQILTELCGVCDNSFWNLSPPQN